MIKLLIAEDEPLSLLVLQNSIKTLIPEVDVIKTATNGHQAVSIAMEFCPDIALLDIEMPMLNGIETAKIIKSKFPNTHIVFLTAYNNFNYAVDALRLNATDYLVKPCSDEDLQEKLINLCYKIDPTLNKTEEVSEQSIFKITVDAYIDLNFKEDISLNNISNALNMSSFYFSKIFKSEYSQNFIDYLTEYKMNKAVELLKNTTLSVKEIGTICGYIDSNYFTKVFKRVMNCTPSAFRQDTQN